MKHLLLITLFSLISLNILATTGRLSFKFKAVTNVPGVKIKGELTEKLLISLTSGAKVVVPIKNLDTGLSMRDDHMRKDIFANKDAEITIKDYRPCEGQKKCELPITIKIQDTSHDYKLKANSTDLKKYEGELSLKLSDFKLPQPSKMGVKVKDEILVNFDIEVGKEK